MKKEVKTAIRKSAAGAAAVTTIAAFTGAGIGLGSIIPVFGSVAGGSAGFATGLYFGKKVFHSVDKSLKRKMERSEFSSFSDAGLFGRESRKGKASDEASSQCYAELKKSA